MVIFQTYLAGTVAASYAVSRSENALNPISRISTLTADATVMTMESDVPTAASDLKTKSVIAATVDGPVPRPRMPTVAMYIAVI